MLRYKAAKSCKTENLCSFSVFKRDITESIVRLLLATSKRRVMPTGNVNESCTAVNRLAGHRINGNTFVEAAVFVGRSLQRQRSRALA